MVVVEGKFRAVGSRPINENARYKQILHDRARRSMVLLQHWSPIAKQVLAEQLWVQVPDLFDHVSHDGLLVAQLRGNHVDEDGAYANDSVPGSVLKIAALSLVFCVSVVFGNISLRFLPISFNQAIGVFREKACGFSLPWI